MTGTIADSIAIIKGVKRAGISANCRAGNNIVAHVAVDDGGWISNKTKRQE